MLLKRIDETISQGLFDLEEQSSEVEVYFVEPSLKGKMVEWNVVDEDRLPRTALHYNDTADSSNSLNRSWQYFYVAGAKLGEYSLCSGSSIFFAKGTPNFGGVAKAAIYLRYSDGFLSWLNSFDPAAAELLRQEKPAFEALMDNPKTKRLPAKWHGFKATAGKWPLVAVCRLSNGRYLALWLAVDAGDTDAILEDMGIDVQHSREIMSFLVAPQTANYEVIAEEFQSGSGLGRNPFGNRINAEAITSPEYQRLMGAIPHNQRDTLLKLWDNKLEYRVKVAPTPDTSSLIFLPEGNLTYSQLKDVIDNENEKRQLYFEAKKRKKDNADGSDEIKSIRPELIPAPYSTTVFLTNVEGSQKKKRIVQQIFPAVSLEYLQLLNNELLLSNLQYAVVDYMKAALTGQDGDPPSVFRYWTAVFTAAMQKQPISAFEVFLNFQRFAKSHSGEELIEKRAALRYFQLIGKLLRLQHFIVTARSSPTRICDNDFSLELEHIEQYQGITTGVFGMMAATTPTGKDLIGEAYDFLRDKQKNKLDSFIRQAWAGVPTADFPVFVRGALAGMLLNELCWLVQQEGRRFSATQGRHPSRLRGAELLRVFDKGVGLLMNVQKSQNGDKAQAFNCRMLPFLKSLEGESRRDSFNSGLITGLVFFEKKAEDKSEVKND